MAAKETKGADRCLERLIGERCKNWTDTDKTSGL